MPSTLFSVGASAVCMITGMNGSSFRAVFAFSRRTTSMPSIFGIMTSSRIRSGHHRSTVASASSRSFAPCTSYPRASRRARRSSMLSSWSSTMRILYSGLRSIILAEEPLHLRDDCPRLARLGEVAVAADLHRLLAIGCKSVRGQRDNGNPLCRRIVLQHLRRLPAIDDRDGDVHQDQVRLF